MPPSSFSHVRHLTSLVTRSVNVIQPLTNISVNSIQHPISISVDPIKHPISISVNPIQPLSKISVNPIQHLIKKMLNYNAHIDQLGAFNPFDVFGMDPALSIFNRFEITLIRFLIPWRLEGFLPAQMRAQLPYGVEDVIRAHNYLCNEEKFNQTRLTILRRANYVSTWNPLAPTHDHAAWFRPRRLRPVPQHLARTDAADSPHQHATVTNPGGSDIKHETASPDLETFLPDLTALTNGTGFPAAFLVGRSSRARDLNMPVMMTLTTQGANRFFAVRTLETPNGREAGSIDFHQFTIDNSVYTRIRDFNLGPKLGAQVTEAHLRAFFNAMIDARDQEEAEDDDAPNI
ncbi:MAG: hypothetical protein Q9183_006033 [Haloplaca sp. 2 TL-2023]